MKNILYIIFFLPIFLLSQNNKIIKITYAKGYKNFKNTSNLEPKIIKGLEYELLASASTSRFEFIPVMFGDNERQNARYIGKGGGDGIYYNNLKNKERLWKLDAYGETFLITEAFKKYEWTLEKSKTKKILGYTCYKAVGFYEEFSEIRKKYINHTAEVWYSPSIPIPFGPADYNGLPGLVLEAKRASFYFIAQKIESLETTTIIERPNKGIEISAKKFSDFLSKRYDRK